MEAPPPGPLRRRVVWVERLTAPTAARLWLEGFVRPSEVRYDPRDATAAGRRAAALAGPRFQPRALICARRADSGEALYYRREDELQQALGGFADAALADRPSNERRALACFLATWLAERETFLVMAEEEARSEPEAEHEYLVVRQPSASLLARPGRALRMDLSARGALRAVAAPLVLWARAFAAALRGPTAADSGLRDLDAVWVEYYPDDVGGYVSRAFWKDALDPTLYDRVFYGDSRDCPVAADAERIAAFGFSWVDARTPWTIAAPSPSILFRLVGSLFGSDRRPWWLRMFEFELALWTEVWEAVFRARRVRLLVQYQDFSWRQEAQARALEHAGGAMIGVHWAEAPFLVEPEHLTPFHVYFAWGVNQSRRLAGKGHDCAEILPCGAWILPRDEETARVRADLGEKEFALALFDTSHSDRIFVSARMVSDFLLGALTLVEANPGWKVVLKPKGEASYAGLPDGARIDAAVARLRSAGRAVLVERTVSPVSVGLACDLALGIGVNSAAVLTGAFGGRCVHWDCAGWTRHPLTRDGAGSVVFGSLEAALAAVAAAPKDPRVGDFSRWARLSNHFGDRRAAERVGGWMADFLTEAASGAPAGETRARASEAYRRRHGVPEGWSGRGAWWVLGA